MCCTSVFTSKVLLVSNFALIFCESFYLQMWYIVRSSCGFTPFLLMVTFFFSKLITFAACSGEIQNVFIQSSPQYIIKYQYFLYYQMPICKEYVHLFLLLKIFKIIFTIICFLNQGFKVWVDYTWCFIWLHILIKF